VALSDSAHGLKNLREKSGRKPQVPPLRCAPVGMTRERAVLHGELSTANFFYEYMPARLSLCSCSDESAANTAAASFEG
jgi:hypothetical protein